MDKEMKERAKNFLKILEEHIACALTEPETYNNTMLDNCQIDVSKRPSCIFQKRTCTASEIVRWAHAEGEKSLIGECKGKFEGNKGSEPSFCKVVVYPVILNTLKKGIFKDTSPEYFFYENTSTSKTPLCIPPSSKGCSTEVEIGKAKKACCDMWFSNPIKVICEVGYRGENSPNREEKINEDIGKCREFLKHPSPLKNEGKIDCAWVIFVDDSDDQSIIENWMETMSEQMKELWEKDNIFVSVLGTNKGNWRESHLKDFDSLYNKWAEEVSQLAKYDTVIPPYRDRISERSRIWIVKAIQTGLCNQVHGLGKFRMITDPEYRYFSWFSDYRSQKKIGPNWEMFAHVAAFSEIILRYRLSLENISFEHEYADITILKDGKVIIMVEVKETKDKARQLSYSLSDSFISGVPMDVPDRHNDTLRKAKYIMNQRPRLFVTYSNKGMGDVFEVEYVGNNGFRFCKKEPTILDEILLSSTSEKTIPSKCVKEQMPEPTLKQEKPLSRIAMKNVQNQILSNLKSFSHDNHHKVLLLQKGWESHGGTVTEGKKEILFKYSGRTIMRSCPYKTEHLIIKKEVGDKILKEIEKKWQCEHLYEGLKLMFDNLSVEDCDNFILMIGRFQMTSN